VRDILTVNFANQSFGFVRMWHHDGTLGFTATDSQVPNLLPDEETGDCGDLDGDGDLDLVAQRNILGVRYVTPLLNDGAGVFTQGPTINTGGVFMSLELLDVDNNTTPDAVWVMQVSDQISYALNQTDVVAPGPFALLSPTDGITGLALPENYSAWNNDRPAFRWARPTGFANSYDLIVSTTGSSPVEVYSAIGVLGTSQPVPDGVLEAGTEYQWQVTAFNAAGSTAASGAFTFTTAEGPRLCPPDLNGDGLLDFFDILDFLDGFSAGCP